MLASLPYCNFFIRNGFLSFLFINKLGLRRVTETTALFEEDGFWVKNKNRRCISEKSLVKNITDLM